MSWFDRARAAGRAFAWRWAWRDASSRFTARPRIPAWSTICSAVEVAPIKDRIGHYLGDDLISNLNGSGETPAAKYRLTVTVTQNSQTPTVSSQINAADCGDRHRQGDVHADENRGRRRSSTRATRRPPRSTTALWTASPTSGRARRGDPASPARWPTRSSCASPRRSARSADRRAGERRLGGGVVLEIREPRDAAPVHRP